MAKHIKKSRHIIKKTLVEQETQKKVHRPYFLTSKGKKLYANAYGHLALPTFHVAAEAAPYIRGPLMVTINDVEFVGASLASFNQSPDFSLYLDPGDATPSDIRELLHALNELQVAYGGVGLEFELTEADGEVLK